MKLSPEESYMLSGEAGQAMQFGMKIIVSAAQASGASRLQPITSAHIVDTLLTGSGETGPDFARTLARMGARVAVPTSINTGSVDMKHPHLNRPTSEHDFNTSQEVMQIFRDMGCSPTYTCSPFQEPQNQLRFGEQVAWAESSAVPYANSVFGARTNRYGHFIATAAAITGRVPFSGLHCEENRRGKIVIHVDHLPRGWFENSLFYHILGYRVGQISGERIPVISGFDSIISNDNLKAFGAAAATSGGISMYHIIGTTPEAPTLQDALHGESPEEVWELQPKDLIRTYEQLSKNERGAPLDAICLGAPHLSIDEIGKVYELLNKVGWELQIPMYLAMSRRSLEVIEKRGWADKFKDAGVNLIVDRCVYFPGILWDHGLAIMTDSAKWASYAPQCISASVTIGTLADCISSGKKGKVILEEGLGGDAV
ncbi:aconitase X catalytic domain-containing protein [Bacillus sp. JJ1566]|uniref:aconitase X catalytic domain-containing protein n=1 Tax=Bacillus sp. JJ1566 TaxID=3122961 RepID=UPI002FFF689E